MNRFLFCVLFLYCFFFSVFPQTPEIDSLKGELSKSTDDSATVMLLNLITKKYYAIDDYEKALNFATLALQKADSSFSSSSGKKKLWYRGMVAKATNSIGAIHWRKANHGVAIRYLLEALVLKEELKDTHGVAISCNLIGLVYWDLKDTMKARENYLRAFSIYEKLNEIADKGKAAANVGNTYVPGDPPAAETWFNRSLKFAEQSNDPVTTGNVYTSLGALYDKMKQYDKAEEYYLKAYDINRRSGNISGQISTNLNIGSLLLNRGLKSKNNSYYKRARTHIIQALNASKETGAKDGAIEAYLYLTELDTLTGDYSSAFEDYKLYVSYRDSVVNEENTKKVVQAQMQYEFDKKEAFAKAEQEKKDAIAAEELKNQKTQRNYFIAGFALVFSLAALILRSFIVKRKANKELARKNILIEQQKQEVEEKQKEVLDSIYYARRIQRALITNEKYFERNLNKLKNR